MVISFSLALLFGVIMFFMIRSGLIKWGPAIVAILFGFSLASTGAADSINNFLQSVTDGVAEVDDSINSAP
ncbi:hypothetical protein RM844_23150 [Streptomyces sp. DSM 44915]|uniref:Uncharacterized protein n=1 Tax=Streptomyces chisholmiae TaxID=3075540 RepID=A0ABU2JW20_9ACTN|nr:hypothetical protein [Streptomyces sp. DSM 44915]MDT0269187.1 hypothetical protein [Streptomyces sp. DSM 44915]